jgi:hypothetical protein
MEIQSAKIVSESKCGRKAQLVVVTKDVSGVRRSKTVHCVKNGEFYRAKDGTEFKVKS